MARFIAVLIAVLITCVPAAQAQFGGGGAANVSNATGTLPYNHGGTGLTTSGVDNTKFLGSDGANGFVLATPAGGGGGSASPFGAAGFVSVSDLNGWYDLAVSPAGDYVYVLGVLASNANKAVAKVTVADGTVSVLDVGNYGGSFAGLAVSPDGSALYFQNTLGDWWKVATAGMTITHHSSALTHAGAGRGFDLSPDGTIYAYTTQNDADLYLIDTTTYAVTTVTMNHSFGDLQAVCFYNGSSSNVYVAHVSSAEIDNYDLDGTYNSTVSTGLGSPAPKEMRSGVNDTFFVATSGSTASIIVVQSGTPTIVPARSVPNHLTCNVLSTGATCEEVDDCYFQMGTTSVADSMLARIDSEDMAISRIPSPIAVNSNEEGFANPAVDPTGTRIYGLGGCDNPVVYNIPAYTAGPPPDVIGNISTSDGKGDWISQAPYFTSSDQTITAAGALTIAHGLGYTPGMVWFQLVCQANDAGYTTGQVVAIGGSQTVSIIAVQNDGFSSIVDATNLTIRYGSDASTFTIPHATTGAATAIDNTKWKCRFFAR